MKTETSRLEAFTDALANENDPAAAWHKAGYAFAGNRHHRLMQSPHGLALARATARRRHLTETSDPWPMIRLMTQKMSELADLNTIEGITAAVRMGREIRIMVEKHAAKRNTFWDADEPDYPDLPDCTEV